MKLLLLVLLVFLMLTGCEGKVEDGPGQEAEKNEKTTFGDPAFSLPELSAAGTEQVRQWNVFEEFLKKAKGINNSDFESLRTASERLLEQTDSLAAKIPDTLNTKPIIGRLTVARTRIGLLHQATHQARLDSDLLQEYVLEFNVAVKNLLVQINEKLKKDAIDLQRRDNAKSEREGMKRFTDSVHRAELRDKKN